MTLTMNIYDVSIITACAAGTAEARSHTRHAAYVAAYHRRLLRELKDRGPYATASECLIALSGRVCTMADGGH